MLHKTIIKKLSALIVFTMILSMLSVNYVGLAAAASNASLSDIDDSYAKAEIAALAEKDIISGFEDGTFKPTDSMTRAQLAKVLVLSLGLPEDAAGAAKFQDVVGSNWFSGYVGTLVKSGITQGTSADAFSPNKSVSREELAVFFTIGEGRASWLSPHQYWKTYQTGPMAGQKVYTDKNDFQYWKAEAHALWGRLDFWGNFVPGLLNPILPVDDGMI